MSTAKTYTLEITVIPGRPRIWRQILVPSDIKLPRLHAVLQRATGAPDSLQRFFIDSQQRIFGHPTWKDLPKIKSDARVRLDRLLRKSGDALAYFSGDADEWEHVVQLLKIKRAIRRLHRATCLAGSRHSHGYDDRANGVFRRSAINKTLRHIPT